MRVSYSDARSLLCILPLSFSEARLGVEACVARPWQRYWYRTRLRKTSIVARGQLMLQILVLVQGRPREALDLIDVQFMRAADLLRPPSVYKREIIVCSRLVDFSFWVIKRGTFWFGDERFD